MEKKIAGLLGAMAALGAFNAAEAAPIPGPAPTDVLRANSFADLLEPIPNAAALLQAVDQSAPAASADENIQLVQYHHHHHHHPPPPKGAAGGGPPSFPAPPPNPPLPPPPPLTPQNPS